MMRKNQPIRNKLADSFFALNLYSYLAERKLSVVFRNDEMRITHNYPSGFIIPEKYDNLSWPFHVWDEIEQIMKEIEKRMERSHCCRFRLDTQEFFTNYQGDNFFMKSDMLQVALLQVQYRNGVIIKNEGKYDYSIQL